jgi:hypothetical protein
VARVFFPLERRLRLRRDSWSQGLVHEAARLGTTQPSFEVAAETLCRLTRVNISAPTVWRQHAEMSQQVETTLRAEEEAVSRIAQRRESPQSERVAARAAIQDHASVSIDGVKVYIRGEQYREVKMVSVSEAVVCDAPPKVVDDGSGVLLSESAEPESRGRQDGLKLIGHSYRAVVDGKDAFSPVLSGELACRRVHRAARVTTVNDGADWIWDLVLTHLSQDRVEVLDWWHALGHVWKAGEAAFGVDTPQTRAWVAERETELWAGQVDAVQVALKKLGRRRGARGKAIRQVRAYVAQHAHRMDYARFRAAGRPIGSGTIESGGKNVVAWRMKRGGQSWSRPGATRMLAALGEIHSRRWDDRLAKVA